MIKGIEVPGGRRRRAGTGTGGRRRRTRTGTGGRRRCRRKVNVIVLRRQVPQMVRE